MTVEPAQLRESPSGRPVAGGAGAVASVFGRVGAVVAQLGDYLASQVTNDSGVAGATVAAALNTLAAVGGQLAGSLPNPSVVGITVTGPTALAIGAVADGQVLQRVAATVVGATPIVGPADPGDNGKIPRASAGNFVYVAGAASDLLTWDGAQWGGAKLVNASVDAAAAIAGTKIAPDFGAQNVVTTGNFVTTGGALFAKTSGAVLQLGLDPGSGAGSAAAAGNIRVASSFRLVGLASNNTTDRDILAWDAAISQLTVGGTASFNILYQASASHLWGVAGVTKFSIVSAELRPAVPIMWSNGTTATISQTTDTGAGTSGNLTITAQSNSNAGATVAGDLLLNGGSCTNTGAVTSQQAGSAWLRGGTFSGSSGTRAHGVAGIRAPGGANVVEVGQQSGGASLLGFFAATPVVKQTLTNSTGGTPANDLVDVGAAYSQANLNNNFASIWTKINNYGLWS